MMADETMLSLFDTDPSFLDELTGSGTGSLSSAPQSLAGVIPDDGGLLSQSLGGMQSTLSQADPLLNTMQPQSYSQISGLSGTCQPSASPPFSDFGQFTPSDLQHISDPSLGRTQNIVTQSQFGNSPGGNSLLQQPAGTYTAYNVSSSQRITTPPQQQLGLVQSPVWNQSPAAGNASFIQQPSQQQAAQQNTGKLHSDVSAYLTHHDYALPPAQQPVPRLSHFPETTKPNQTSYLQGGLGSPPPTSRIVSISSPNSIGHMQSRPVTSQPFASGAQTTPAQSGINLNNFGTQHQMQSFHSDFIKQGPQLNSGTSQVGNLQHFTYTVQQNQTTGSQAIGDAPPLTHYSSSSPHGSPFRTPYSGVPPRGSALSPRPTPTPPSPMSSDCFSHVSSPQGGLTQSNLQQLEQLVAPSLNTVTSKPYNQVMQTSSISLHSGAQNIPVSSTAVFVNSFQGNSSDSQLVADKLNSSMGVTINTSLQTSAVGQSSPSCVVIPCVSSQQSSEIQQQIGQYCSVAQPEQLHLIKAQHPQPHILQIQRQPKNPQPAAQVQTNIQQLLPHSVVAVTSQASQFQQPQTSASSSPQKIHTITMQPSQCSEMIQHVPSSQQNQLPPQVPVAAVTKPALQTTIVITHGALQKDLPQLPDLREPEKPAEERILSPPKRKREVAKLRRAQQQQEKANKIISEAIAKAQAEGKTELPRVVTPSIPLTVTELTKEEETKPKKRERKPKGEKKPKTPKTPKPKPSSRKKPVATFLKNKKKRLGHSSDASDIEVTPLPSPENEDDNVKKRRSARNTKRKKYLDDIDINLSDENQEVDIESIDGVMAPKPVQFFVENPSEEDAVIVEKILGMRIRKVYTENELEDVEEFFVKYKNFSYLHCEWKTVQELEKDKRIHMKLKRYRIKRLQMNNYFEVPDEEELFNPDYVEVDRVLDVSETPDPVSGEVVIHYLVKWRGLPYDESTWELLQDVDPAKVRLFKKIREIPPEADLEHKLRPSAADWKKLSESRNYKNANQLRDYQLEGVNWLKFSWYNRQNCILADEMGLGKTIQSLAFLKEMSLCGIKGPFLVVAPLSTIANWQREFETWTDMNVIVYHGTSPSRNMIQEYEMYYKNENGQRLTNIYKFNALITTYEIIISDCEVLSQVEWRCAIIDEAHRLKNKNCRLLQGLTMFDIEHRVLLTGTPLQNNVEELFSLLNFLEPDKFHSSEAFLSEFGDLQTDTQVEKLQQILKPMMLRRIKEDVEKNLAPKEETIVEVELTNIQKKYYRAILEKNFTFLAKGSTSSTNVPNLMNTMMELRKCCNHPYLVTGAEEKILEDARQRDGNDPEKLFNAMVQSSGKLVLLDKLLPKLKQGGHKVLIFSQMIRVLDILEDYLLQKRYLYERLDGRIRGNLRQEAIDRFSKPESDRFIFLLCTRAGGLGINLTAADTVIIYDSDWNPQNDLQAQARCHRIGQSKAVKVYRLITRNSYEREMFDRASRKLGLDKAVLQSMSGEKPVNLQAQLSKKEIEDLLRKGAYGALMEEDNAGDKFCEEDIDQILQRRTRVIQIETEGKGSTFAKASFSMTSNSDIDINDPNFWQKWAKKAELDVNELNSKNDLIIQEPRQRRQTTRYGNNDLVEVSDLDSSSDSDEMGDKIEEFSKRRGRKKGSTRRKFIDDEFEADELIGDGYARSELFKVEKNLLVYGWGRWMDILNHGRFKRTLTEKDVETISRAMLLYSLQHYKGDERIKSFIWDLVTPSNDGTLKNHMGLSAPVPRGRKGKKAKKEAKNFSAAIEMEKANLQMDPEIVLSDSGYKRHIQRHSNKVLLRVRLLYYLKQEVIGDESERINRGVNISDLDIPNPCAEGDPPVFWWDEEADKSLLIGVFKHGYEKYNLMRQDPYLCFLSKCGPPDGAALLREQNDEDDNDNKDDDDDGDLRMNCSQLDRDDEDDDISLSSAPGTPCRQPQCIQSYETTENGKLPFPSPPDLNTRLRRVITGYQRNHKKEQLKIAQKAKRMERRERAEAANKEREIRKRKSQQRWSRREEADFYRIVSTFGVEYDRDVKRYQWDRFRALARLEKKYDDTLTEYFQAFYHMCLQVCAKFNKEDEGKQATSSSVPSFPPNNIFIEPITEERASRCLARIDLLNKIREEIICHPKFEENLKLCQASFDMPSWWICGKHDKDLMVGAARHGVARTDYHILHDPTLSFKEILGNKVNNWTPTPWLCGLSNFGLNRIMKPETPSIKDEDSDVESKDGREKDQVMHDFDKKEEPLSPKMELEESSKDKQLQTDETDSSPKDDIDEMEVDELCKEIEEEIPDRGEEYQSKFSDFEDATQSQGSLTNQIDELGMELDSNEHHTVAEILARSAHGVSVMWPKDKVIFHRLEQICYCVENMEWPGLRRSSYMLAVPDSRSATPVGSSTPKCEVGDSDAGDSLPDALKVKKSCLDKDFQVQMSEGDGLKMRIQKRRRGRRKGEQESDRAFALQHFMNQSAFSSDNESQSEPINLSALQVEHGLMKRKRGRKRKPENLSDVISSIKQNSQLTALTAGPEARVPVISLEDGSRLSGDEAPMRKDLDKWLDEHPGYTADRPDFIEEEQPPPPPPHYCEPVEKRRRRRPRLDPSKLNLESLTGDENVSVINRETGKKITGAKAPPLKYLGEWLEKNPSFDIDPKWGEIVRAKGNLPETLESRILQTSGRRRRHRDNSLPTSMLGDTVFSPASLGAFRFPNTGLMAGFPKLPFGLPFGTLPNLSMANPMLGLTGFNMPAITAAAASLDIKNTNTTENSDKDNGSDTKSTSSAAITTTSATPHPSFPLLYSPLLYNPLLAAQGLTNFTLPTTLATSFASLAQGGGVGVLNGRTEGHDSESDDEEKQYYEEEQVNAEDLSLKNTGYKQEAGDKKKENEQSNDVQQTATDLTVKTKNKPKILNSLKLNRIVDSLKDKVLKIEERQKDKSGQHRKEKNCNQSDTQAEKAEKSKTS